MSENTGPKIYALIAGIDNYPIPRHRLNGCVNDASAFKAYLEGNFPCEQIDIKFIPDEKASRQGIVDGFKQFEKAQNGDVCVFYFSGHGSRVPAPPEFLHLEPDGMLESLVCHDSRNKGGMDLMDKELSYLIAQATKDKDVHFLAVFDCCHAGTNTRAVGADNVTSRMAEPAHSPARAADFLGSDEYFTKQATAGVGLLDWQPPKGRHVHLAASRSSETAKELRINGQTRGAFTYSLIEVLQQSGGNLKYTELLEHLRSRISDRVSKQTPQLEAFVNNDDKYLQFLNQPNKPRQMSYAIEKTDNKWYLQAGQFQGLPTGKGGEIQVSIQEKGNEVASSNLASIEAHRSEISNTSQLSDGTVYRGVITDMPSDKAKIALLASADQSVGPILEKVAGEMNSLFFNWTSDLAEADYQVDTWNGHLVLLLPDGDRPLFKRVEGLDEKSAIEFLGRVDSVARYRFVRAISNPNTGIRDDEFSIEWYRIQEAGAWEASDDAPADLIEDLGQAQIFEHKYDDENEAWKLPSTRMKIKNTGKRPLHFSVLNLTPQFGINNRFMEGQWLKPNEEAWIGETIEGETFRTLPLSVHEAFTKMGIAEVEEYFKVFIGTAEGDTNSMRQEALEMDTTTKRAGRSALLAARRKRMGPDWRTVDLTMKIVKPVVQVAIADGGSGDLAGQVMVALPQGTKAKAALSGAADAERNLPGIGDEERSRLPDQVPGWELHQFGTGMGKMSAASVLELMEVEGSEQINADNPIRIELKNKAADDIIVPVAYDAETGLLIPVGVEADGGFVIEDLPAPTPNGTRSLTGSIKIFFQKAVLSKVGVEYTYPQLAQAVFKDEENTDFEYFKDTATIKERVASAERIVVFIHGIIGDTTEMPKAARLACTSTGELMETKYNLLLTFDYESLNTPIEQTAKDLKQRLAELGLGENHGKELHIIAHSMGGLVSRWFIEKEGGNNIVQHLIQVGTPNNGSPWSSVYELASTFLAQAVNGSAFFQPYMVSLRFIGKVLDKLFLTLEQMHADSDFLKKLNDGTDPGIPYTIIAGNTQLIPPIAYEKQVKLLMKILRRFKDRGHYQLLDRVLFKSANDIAVSVESISTIAGAENRQFPITIMPVACDHISYFANPQGLEELGKAVS